jgi:hypothetical protein
MGALSPPKRVRLSACSGLFARHDCEVGALSVSRKFTIGLPAAMLWVVRWLGRLNISRSC